MTGVDFMLSIPNDPISKSTISKCQAIVANLNRLRESQDLVLSRQVLTDVNGNTIINFKLKKPLEDPLTFFFQFSFQGYASESATLVFHGADCELTITIHVGLDAESILNDINHFMTEKIKEYFHESDKNPSSYFTDGRRAAISGIPPIQTTGLPYRRSLIHSKSPGSPSSDLPTSLPRASKVNFPPMTPVSQARKSPSNRSSLTGSASPITRESMINVTTQPAISLPPTSPPRSPELPRPASSIG